MTIRCPHRSFRTAKSFCRQIRTVLGRRKSQKRFTFGVSSDDSLGDQTSFKLCPPDFPGSGSSNK
eukprot:3556701-Pleurochrysis_carterae.AAC.1